MLGTPQEKELPANRINEEIDEHKTKDKKTKMKCPLFKKPLT